MKNALTLSACLALSMSAGSLGAQTAAPASAGGAMGHGSKQMHEQMMSGMQKMQGMQLTGDTDKDFAMMMRMHHQQAIEMAQAEIQHGKSPEMKAMAKKIVDDQKKEIAEFDKYLAKRK
jgi:uncharacterized protein (DUF305 family)